MFNYFINQRNNMKKTACVVVVITFIIDVFFSGQPIGIKMSLYFATLLMCVFVWFGIYFILWIQLKNPFCSVKMLNFLVGFFLIFSVITSAFSLLYFCFNYRDSEYMNSTFLSLTSMLTVIRFQCKREHIKF